MTRRRLPIRCRALAALLLALAALLPCLTALAQNPPGKQKLLEAPAPSVPTNELLVFLKPGTDPAAFAHDYGLEVVYRLRSDPDAYVFATVSVRAAREAARTLELDRRPRAVYNNEIVPHERHAFVPDDPYFPKDSPTTGWPGQWYLVNPVAPGRDAGLAGAWARDLTGEGVTIGVVDDGLQIDHPDLAPNYAAARSWDFWRNDPNPSPASPAEGHGTVAAGIAAARGGNGIGITGAAPRASLAGLRVDFNTPTVAQFVDATLYRSNGPIIDIGVKTHSYGAEPFARTQAEYNALTASATVGTIHVFSAGNERDMPAADSNKKMLQGSPDAITVAALGGDGVFAAYSSFGANVFVAAPASGAAGFDVLSTDLTGSDGYNAAGPVDAGSDPFPDIDYASRYGGTSAAAPLVAGVMALGRQAHPALDVRLAKHALVRSSRIVDLADATTAGDGGWKVNAAGFHHNQNYGFGRIDADAFTRWVVALGGVSPRTFEAEPQTAVGAAIPDASPEGIGRTFAIAATTPLEEVQVGLDILHESRGQVEAYLTSPSGTRSRLLMRAPDPAHELNWTFTSNAFWGENPHGTWTLTVVDTVEGSGGIWDGFSALMRMGTPLNQPVALSGLALTTPAPVKAGTTATARVTLSGPAPAGGALVRLYSDSADAAVPETVTVPEGQTSADFDVAVDVGGTGRGEARLLAEYGASRAVRFTIYRHSISGTVRRDGAGQAGVAVRAYSPSVGTVTGDAAPDAFIPDRDNTGVTSTITLPDVGTVASVTVGVNISHSSPPDLEITLIHPDGTEVILRPPGIGGVSLVTSYPPSVPFEPLSKLNGKPLGGDWKLRVRDRIFADTGTFHSWSLSVADEEVERSATTAADGTYTIYGLPAGTYGVTPRHSQQSFTPSSRSVTVGPGDAASVNFTTLIYTALDLAQADDGTTRILTRTGNTVRIVRWDGAAAQVGSAYTPAAGWAAVGIAADNGGRTLLLWKNGTTSYQIWRLGRNGVLDNALAVQTAGGWTAADIACAGDGTARVLLVGPAGQVKVVRVDRNAATAGPVYTPAAGWSAAGIGAAGEKTHLLWRKGATSYQLWTLAESGALESAGPVQPAAGFTARAVSQAADGSSRVLLATPSNQVRVNRLSGGVVQPGPLYTPAAGYVPVGIAANQATDSLTRLLWQHGNGTLSLWTLGPTGTLQGSAALGTY